MRKNLIRTRRPLAMRADNLIRLLFCIMFVGSVSTASAQRIFVATTSPSPIACPGSTVHYQYDSQQDGNCHSIIWTTNYTKNGVITAVPRKVLRSNSKGQPFVVEVVWPAPPPEGEHTQALIRIIAVLLFCLIQAAREIQEGLITTKNWAIPKSTESPEVRTFRVMAVATLPIRS
jgi:hypothetical protein